MNPQSQSLPRSVFAAVCAFALAAGMALPMLGATRAYAEEVSTPVAETAGNEGSDAVEGANTAAPSTEVLQDGVDATVELPAGIDSEISPAANEAPKTYTVMFGTNGSQDVVQGDKVIAPTMPDITYNINGKNVTATFAGWYQTEAADGWIPVKHNGNLFEEDLIGSEKERKALFVNKKQLLDTYITHPASSSIPIDGNMTFWAIYTVPAHVISLGIYDEGQFARVSYLKVIEGDPLVSDETWLWSAAGFTIEKWGFAGEPFDVNTTPITEDLTFQHGDVGADGWAKTMVQVYLTKNPSGNSLPVSGSTGISASGDLTGPNIPENAAVSLGATAITSGEAYSALMGKVGNGTLVEAFDVNLAANGLLVHNGFGTLTLTFPIDATYNGQWVTIYHRHNDGSITSEKAVAKNGAVSITVTDLSTFALGVDKVAEVKPEGNEGVEVKSDVDKVVKAKPLATASSSSKLAQTGDAVSGLALVGTVVAAGTALAFAGYRSRKQTQK